MTIYTTKTLSFSVYAPNRESGTYSLYLKVINEVDAYEVDFCILSFFLKAFLYINLNTIAYKTKPI